MASSKSGLFLNVLALICAIWFLAFGWIWPYLANLIFALPVGIIGAILWYLGRKLQPGTLNKATLVILIIGVFTSIGALILFR